MTINVLFMCPHSAGKSLMAATYFRAAAVRHGLDVSVSTAGPDPDEHNMPNVTAALIEQGYTIAWDPRLVTTKDTQEADLMISVGCDHDSIPTRDAITEWDVPLLSEDFEGSMTAIHVLAERLASEWNDGAGH